MEPVPVMSLGVSEADFTTATVEMLQWHGWLVHHSRPAMTSRGYRTALQGDRGCPDILAARANSLILWELKTQKGKLDAHQIRWQKESMALVMRPVDWPLMVDMAKTR